MVKQLTLTEIRTLIRGHNKMSQIKVPTGLDRAGLIKFLKSRKYKVDHVKKRLVDLTDEESNSRGRITTLATAKSITKPKPKTDAQKQKSDESKAKKAEAKAKEIKLAKKEGVKEFKQKKAEATKKPAVKKPAVKKPTVKKAPMKKEDEVRKARQPYPTIPPNVKGKRIPKGQLLLQDKKQGQVVKKTVKPSLKDKLIAKDKKAISDEKKAIKQRKEDKKPYQPSADSDLKEQMFKLNDYFAKDKNKIGNTFKTIKEVNSAIGKLFTAVKGGSRGEDQLEGLDTSERKYFIKLLNNMLRFSTKEKTGVEVTPRALQKYKGYYNPAAATEARESERKKEAAPAQLEKKLLKAGSQLEDKPAIRAREKAEREKAKAKTKAKEDKAKAKEKPKEKPVVSQSVTFDYEETSGHSDVLKKALKQTYDLANSIVNKVMNLKPMDFVENEQMVKYRMEPFDDDLDDDEDFDTYSQIYEELDNELDKKLREILNKNRKETNWTKAKPALKPMQTKYIQSMQEFKENNQPRDFQAAKRQKDLILKHYSAQDVPAVPNKEPKKKPKFKIDQSKQPKQTPSTKIDIDIKPASNTMKIKPKKKEEGDRGPDGSGIADLHKKAKVLTPKIWDELNTKYKIGKPIQDRYKSLIANKNVRDIRYKLGEGPSMGRGTEGIAIYWDILGLDKKWTYMMGKTNKITPNKKSGGGGGGGGGGARGVWDSVKDLKWKQNVRTQILALFNEGIPRGRKYYVIKGAEIKKGKLIIKYVFTRERAEAVLERDKGESSEEEVIKYTTVPRTASFTIPK